MKLGTTYICVADMDVSVQFYTALLQQPPVYANDDRWVTFACGNTISLYNKKYDERLLEHASSDHFNQAYLKDFYGDVSEKKNTIVIFNFEVDNLKSEYERIRSLNIGEVSDLMYVNVHMPYWYFNIKDPDGNVLEIAEGCMEV